MSNKYLIIIPEITKGMKSLGPKSLLKINSQTTILDQQIRFIKSINRRNKIYLSTGFQHSKIQKKIERYTNVNTIYEKDFDKYNETKHLLNFIERADCFDDVFVINSGIILRNNCLKKNKNNNSKIYVLDKPKDNFYVGCGIEESKYLFYELPEKWSECLFLSKEVLTAISEINKVKPLHNHFLFEIINMVSDYFHIDKEIISNRDILKITNTTDLKKAKRFI